jgi:hypothetical protein
LPSLHQDPYEGGVSSSVGSGEMTDELLFVLVGEFLNVVEEGFVDSVNLLRGDGYV